MRCHGFALINNIHEAECRLCFKHYSRHYNELAYHRMEGNKCLGHQPIKDAQQFSLQKKRI